MRTTKSPARKIDKQQAVQQKSIQGAIIRTAQKA